MDGVLEVSSILMVMQSTVDVSLNMVTSSAVHGLSNSAHWHGIGTERSLRWSALSPMRGLDRLQRYTSLHYTLRYLYVISCLVFSYRSSSISVDRSNMKFQAMSLLEAVSNCLNKYCLGHEIEHKFSVKNDALSLQRDCCVFNVEVENRTDVSVRLVYIFSNKFLQHMRVFEACSERMPFHGVTVEVMQHQKPQLRSFCKCM